MEIRRTAIALAGVFALSSAPGCAWAPLRSEGEPVRVLRTQADDCVEVGQATARTRAYLGPFRRSIKVVNRELETLARNEAGAMGGNALRPRGPSREGAQRFDVLRCR